MNERESREIINLKMKIKNLPGFEGVDGVVGAAVGEVALSKNKKKITIR